MSWQKIVLFSAVLTLIFGLVIIVNKSGNSGIVSTSIKSGNLQTPSPTPSPTPTPIVLNENSNLETETENLTPEDFSNDYKLLKAEAGKL